MLIRSIPKVWNFASVIFKILIMKKLILLALVVIQINVFAQDEETKHYLSLELDPAPFILKGYSYNLKFSHANAPRFAIMGSVFSSHFPDGMMKKENKDAGWNKMNIETSYAIFIDYFFKSIRSGFYVGPSMLWYNKSVGMQSTEKRISFQTIYPSARIGYVWYPFNKIGLYINPWLNMGSEINLDDKNSIEGKTFETNTLNYILALHIGYSVTF
jgi:hypothetical protein